MGRIQPIDHICDMPNVNDLVGTSMDMMYFIYLHAGQVHNLLNCVTQSWFLFVARGS